LIEAPPSGGASVVHRDGARVSRWRTSMGRCGTRTAACRSWRSTPVPASGLWRATGSRTRRPTSGSGGHPDTSRRTGIPHLHASRHPIGHAARRRLARTPKAR